MAEKEDINPGPPVQSKTHYSYQNKLDELREQATETLKSFTIKEPNELEDMGFESDAFPKEYQRLVKRAYLDPNSLFGDDFKVLVDIICSKAFERIKYSGPAAYLCFSIIQKEDNNIFLEGLENSCRAWYKDRDKLLRYTSLEFSPDTTGLQSWTAYVYFLIELYLRVKRHRWHVQQTSEMASTTAQAIGPRPISPVAKLSCTLQTLLFECANIELKSLSLINEGGVDIVKKILNTVGKELEEDQPQRMQHLMCNVRDVFFINPSLNDHIRKTLMEIVELHASKWVLDMAQIQYYYQSTDFYCN